MQDFGLVVIGAHSGFFLKDLVSEYQDQNILLVEPVPYNYEILDSEYKDDPKVIICKNAIIDKSKKDFFYYVKKESIAKLGKHWASQIGSFDKNHILNHKNKRFDIKEDDIETIQIEFITFDDSLRNRREIINRAPDISKITKIFGYKPKISLDDGLTRVIKKYNKS